MKLTLVRHATLLLETGGRRVLVDPMLRPAGSTPPIENTPSPARNPLVELPFPAEEVVAGIDGCIVTHLHGDHFDDEALALLPRDVPILTQPASAEILRGHGFERVTVDPTGWLGLEIELTGGHHGTGSIGEAMGVVFGFVLDGVYVAGDTIWCDEVRDAIERHEPRTVVVNAGGARFLEGDPIVMDVAGVETVGGFTDATVVVVHLETMNHCLEGRAVYRAIAGVVVPDDGETLEI